MQNEHNKMYHFVTLSQADKWLSIYSVDVHFQRLQRLTTGKVAKFSWKLKMYELNKMNS